MTKIQLSKRVHDLFVNEFTVRGEVAWNATDTCGGTFALWRKLEGAGFVKRQKYKSALGHPFSFTITPAGIDYLKERAQ